MRKQNETENKTTIYNSALHIVTPENERANLEKEIEKHINVIKTLINRMRPLDRQKYYHGFLAHILNEPANHPEGSSVSTEKDISALSTTDILLIRELSEKMEELYRYSE